MTQPEALRLAEYHECAADLHSIQTAAELRRLHQFAEDQIGRATAAEAALQMTKATHALKIAAVEAQRDALLEALKGITPPMPPIDAPCHYGLVQQEKCAHCRRIAKARAAIKAAEGENR